jgi:hypothetical protein
VNDDDAGVAERRRSGAEKRMLGWRLGAPQELSAGGIEGGDDAADAEREQLALMKCRRRLRTGAVSSRRTAAYGAE